MYHSTIQRRTQPITADDFDALEGSSLSARSRRDGRMRLDFWNKYVPVAPRDIVRIFDAVALPDMRLTCLNDEGGYLNINVSDGRGTIRDVSFEYDLERKRLTSSLIDLLKHKTGAGTRLFRAKAELAAALGFGSVGFSTSMQGGLVWPRRGCEIDPAFDKTRLSSAIRARLESVGDCLPRDMLAHCRTLADLSGADDINALAALDFALPETITIDDYYSSDGARRKTMSAAFTDAASGRVYTKGRDDELNEIRALIDRRDREGSPIRLGEFLLAGSKYEIRLDFSDDRQMKKLERHNGAFGFIAACN